MDRAYLAIDIGTSAVRAGVIDPRGELLGLGSCGYDFDFPAPDRVEADPDGYWRATVSASRGALAEARSRPGAGFAIGGISTSSQGETLICLDRQRRPLGPAIVWLDNRARREAALIGEAVPPAELYARTGKPESVATWPAAKLLWLSAHEPERFAATSRFVLLGDWIAFRLCGQLAAEETLQSGNLLLDLRTREWWDRGLELAGVGSDRLPPLVQAGSVLGPLGEDAAAEIGLAERPPVFAGAMDQVAAALGAGNVRPGLVTETTGTTLCLATTFGEEWPGHEDRIPVYLHTRPGTYCALPYLQTGGATLSWLHDVLCADGEGSRGYEALVGEAEAIPPGAEGLTFVPHLAGAFFPEFDMQAKGAIVGLTLRHGRGHVVRSALEAVAYGLRQALEALFPEGRGPTEVVSLGGGAANDVWSAIKADVCGLPLRRLACPEATLLGAAMLTAVGLGDHPDQAAAIAAMSRTADSVEPDARNAAAYEEGYRRYLDACAGLRPLWRDRSSRVEVGG